MEIQYHNNFVKKFKKLNKKTQLKVINAIKIFSSEPYNFKLKNHKLKGDLLGQRAISVTGDFRIIFQEFEFYTLVIMLDVGTHNQVY